MALASPYHISPPILLSCITTFIFLITLSSIIKPSQQYEDDQNLSVSYNTTYPLNPRLLKAFHALQAWKHSIISDPSNFTFNWYGPKVCNYSGVFCAPAPDNPHVYTVAGIDLNHANLAGTLPEDLGFGLSDLAVFHLNSNRFCGTLPSSFRHLRLLHELDISNNKFSGYFPDVVLDIPSLKYLDIRFNNFHGVVSSRVFDLNLDALFLNNNKFRFSLPENLGNSSVSVVVFANNDLSGCLPASLGRMKATLNEILIVNSGLKGCLPESIGKLDEVTVFDVSGNELVGELPESIAGMKKLEQLNVADNKLSGDIPASVCSLPRLQNFTYSFNYFCSEPPECLKLPAEDDRKNCIPYRPLQRSEEECKAFYDHPVNCSALGCSFKTSPPPPPPLPPSPPPPTPCSPPSPPAYHHYP